MDQSIKNLVWLALAGLSGSVVGARVKQRQRKKLTAADMAWYVLCGLLVAFFFTPMLCRLFNVTVVEDVRALAFATGAGWSKILDLYSQRFDNKTLAGAKKND